jgi:hypothetical protein
MLSFIAQSRQLSLEEQQQIEQAAASIGVGAMIGLVLLSVLSIALMIWTILTISKVLSQVPAQFRATTPGMAWMLLVPCANLVFLFLLPAKIADSVHNYYRAQGGTPAQIGDAGRNLGLWWGLTLLLCGPVGWILQLMYTNKLTGLSKMLPPAQS